MQRIVSSIPTVYKNTSFRSRLEADFAFLLDGLNISWSYEPRSFLLDDGTHYWPDFWLPTLRLWVECRGYDSEKGQRQINGFANWVESGELTPAMRRRTPLHFDSEDFSPPSFDELVDYLVVREHAMFVELGAADQQPRLARCAKCSSWFFFGCSGSFRCRACGHSDGDHHLDAETTIELFGGQVMLNNRTSQDFANYIARQALGMDELFQKLESQLQRTKDELEQARRAR